ncbi:MAG TPA: VOC family protein [Solirubrobacterales bacterium]|nr:VOC family protein [Solirubrobacterales bacterium]
MGELDHVGIVVADLERARGWFESALGLAVSSEATLAGGSLKIAFLEAGAVRVELIEVLDPAARRERLGEDEARIEHLAFRVGDLPEAAGQLEREGVELRGGVGADAPREPFSGAGTTSLFSRPESSVGVRVQLVQPDAAEERG